MNRVPCILAFFLLLLCSFWGEPNKKDVVTQGGIPWAESMRGVPRDIALVSRLSHNWQCVLETGCFYYRYHRQRGKFPIWTQFWARQGDEIGQSGDGVYYPYIGQNSGWCCGACSLGWHCR